MAILCRIWTQAVESRAEFDQTNGQGDGDKLQIGNRLCASGQRSLFLRGFLGLLFEGLLG